ncbi:hypothetical protein BV20DRAFT_1056862 [Pilatotrama ljubarskyi]|nr:hypothetical protein BV20DRAFT_1056862 [Pilatotrama ljubarskyi]
MAPTPRRWEAAKKQLERREPAIEPPQLKRTGTWPFMPADCTYADGKRFLAVADEPESFFSPPRLLRAPIRAE